MKVLNPNNETHTITLQPRFDPTSTLEMELINEVSKVKSTITPSYDFFNGVVNVAFSLTVQESDRYSIKITEDNKVIYRDTAFCTSQEKQDYKLTKDKYTYYNG